VDEIYRLKGDIRGKIRRIEQNVLVMRKISTDFGSRNGTNAEWEQIDQYTNANHELLQEINQLFEELKSKIPEHEHQIKLKEEIVKQLLSSLSSSQKKCSEYRLELKLKGNNDKFTKSQEERITRVYHTKSGILRQKIDALIMKDLIKRYEEKRYAEGIETRLKELRDQTRKLTEEVRRLMDEIIQLQFQEKQNLMTQEKLPNKYVVVLKEVLLTQRKAFEVFSANTFWKNEAIELKKIMDKIHECEFGLNANQETLVSKINLKYDDYVKKLFGEVIIPIDEPLSVSIVGKYEKYKGKMAGGSVGVIIILIILVILT